MACYESHTFRCNYCKLIIEEAYDNLTDHRCFGNLLNSDTCLVYDNDNYVFVSNKDELETEMVENQPSSSFCSEIDKCGTRTTHSNVSDLKTELIKWDENATSLLLDKYESYMSQIGPRKRFKTKRRMWEEISNDLKKILGASFTPTQVENRYKTVLKRKKEAVDHNGHTGEEREEVPFEEELNKIASLDDSIEPEVLRSGNKVFLKDKPSTSNNIHPKKITKVKSVQEVLQEIHKEKERNKEKRHREKIELLAKLCEQMKKKGLTKLANEFTMGA